MSEKVKIKDIIRPILTPIHPEGYMFIGVFAVITLVLYILYAPLAIVGGVLTLWCAYFFRNPDRRTPLLENAIISPADGIIQDISDAMPPGELQLGTTVMRRISVFMNVFDVHVNRIPIDGKIIEQHYRKGKFFDASMDKASLENERHSFALECNDGTVIAFVQIAGFVARRILTWVPTGAKTYAGERFGLIRFGSRVDVYIPHSADVFCAIGQKAIAGETILAKLADRNKADEKTLEQGQLLKAEIRGDTITDIDLMVS